MGTTEHTLTEERKAQLAETYGLSEPEPQKTNSFLSDFDFGYSINFPKLMISIILLVMVAVALLYFIFRKRKKPEA